MKNKNYNTMLEQLKTQCWNNSKHNAGTIQKSNRKIIERGKIDTPKNTK
jgi:hypothetical protein